MQRDTDEIPTVRYSEVVNLRKMRERGGGGEEMERGISERERERERDIRERERERGEEREGRGKREGGRREVPPARHSRPTAETLVRRP